MDLNLIKVYDNVLPVDTCNYIIESFEKMESIHETYKKNGFWPYFTEIRLATNLEDETHGELCKQLNQYVEQSAQAVLYNQYLKDIPVKSFPTASAELDGANRKTEWLWEGGKIKRYLPNTQMQFKLHADNAGPSTVGRWLAFFWYLNDIAEENGGCTVFKYNDESEELLRVRPKAGRMLVFPPQWTYPHLGEPVTGSTPKYLIGAYLRVM